MSNGKSIEMIRVLVLKNESAIFMIRDGALLGPAISNRVVREVIKKL